jgi:hypothetical protein
MRIRRRAWFLATEKLPVNWRREADFSVISMVVFYASSSSFFATAAERSISWRGTGENGRGETA